jgi:hypothetical protein
MTFMPGSPCGAGPPQLERADDRHALSAAHDEGREREAKVSLRRERASDDDLVPSHEADREHREADDLGRAVEPEDDIASRRVPRVRHLDEGSDAGGEEAGEWRVTAGDGGVLCRVLRAAVLRSLGGERGDDGDEIRRDEDDGPCEDEPFANDPGLPVAGRDRLARLPNRRSTRDIDGLGRGDGRWRRLGRGRVVGSGRRGRAEMRGRLVRVGVPGELRSRYGRECEEAREQGKGERAHDPGAYAKKTRIDMPTASLARCASLATSSASGRVRFAIGRG